MENTDADVDNRRLRKHDQWLAGMARSEKMLGSEKIALSCRLVRSLPDMAAQNPGRNQPAFGAVHCRMGNRKSTLIGNASNRASVTATLGSMNWGAKRCRIPVSQLVRHCRMAAQKKKDQRRGRRSSLPDGQLKPGAGWAFARVHRRRTSLPDRRPVNVRRRIGGSEIHAAPRVLNRLFTAR